MPKLFGYFHKYGKYSNFNKSGHRIAWIDLKDNIPRILNIRETQNFLYVTYPNQPFACNECGKTGHRARQCKTNKSDFVNVIDVNSLQDENNGDDNNDEIVGIDIEDIDIHIASSQSTNKFACTLCDYKCAYDTILQEHMEGHTSESALPCSNDKVVKSQVEDFKCFLCDTVSQSKSAYDAHLAIHDIEIQLSCNECDFECSNEDVLNNHISTHNTYRCKVCNFTFQTAKHLSEHGKMHNVSKINCNECDFTCSNKTELKNHRKQHTGEKSGPIKRDHSISPEANVSNKKAALRNKNSSK